MTVQGEFRDHAQADQAKNVLMANRIAPSRIRIWNIIPDTDAGSTRRDSTATGALTGGAIGGGGGLVFGAAIGAALEDDGPRLPVPSGVRIVVDVENETGAIETILWDSGAVNVGIHRE